MNKIVIKKIIIKPIRKEYSANVSYNCLRFDLLRIERNAHKQLNIKITKHAAVISSINVVAENLKNFKEVNTRKQNPRKLVDELKICGDLLLSSIKPLFYSKRFYFFYIHKLLKLWLVYFALGI